MISFIASACIGTRSPMDSDWIDITAARSVFFFFGFCCSGSIFSTISSSITSSSFGLIISSSNESVDVRPFLSLTVRLIVCFDPIGSDSGRSSKKVSVNVLIISIEPSLFPLCVFTVSVLSYI